MARQVGDWTGQSILEIRGCQKSEKKSFMDGPLSHTMGLVKNFTDMMNFAEEHHIAIPEEEVLQLIRIVL